MRAQPSPVTGSLDDTLEVLVTWLTAQIAEFQIPGAAIGVTVGDDRLARAIGVTETGTDHAFTPSTLFGIASLSKIFTATALASLVHEGTVSLEDPVTTYLPDLRLASPDDTTALTVGHLLSHAGGWADMLEPVPGEDSLSWYATQMANLPQVAPVGTKFGYSNSGFMLAGSVIEQITGATYEDVIDETVLKPLDMDFSAFTSSEISSTKRALGHQLEGDDLVAIPIPENPRVINPAGGLLSTLDDMLNFVHAHASINTSHLNPEMLASMRQPQIEAGSVGPVAVDHIGLGWMMFDFEGETVLMSQGGDSGLISAMIAVPSRQFGIVTLVNSDTGMTLANDTVLRGMADFTGLARPESKTHPLTDAEARNATGQFGLTDWMTFTTAPTNGSLHVSASAGGEEVADFSGDFTMISPYQGHKPFLSGKIWMDLVPDDTGTIQWLRFAARLLPRIA